MSRSASMDANERGGRARQARRHAGPLTLLMAFAGLLGACSDIYFDRRETISFHAGDAAASNVVVQAVDPWPRAAGKRDLEANGERMQRAIQRYRTNRTTPLVTTSTSSVQYQSATQGTGAPAPASGGTTP